MTKKKYSSTSFVTLYPQQSNEWTFLATDLDALKQKEKILREKEDDKYFRCKINDNQL